MRIICGSSDVKRVINVLKMFISILVCQNCSDIFTFYNHYIIKKNMETEINAYI